MIQQILLRQSVEVTSFKAEINNWIYGKISKDAATLCSRKNPSILRQTDKESLLNFSDKFLKKLEAKAPLLFHALRAAVVIKQKRKKITNGESQDTSYSATPMAVSILTKTQCPDMIAQAYCVGFILHLSDAKMLVSDIQFPV